MSPCLLKMFSLYLIVSAVMFSGLVYGEPKKLTVSPFSIADAVGKTIQEQAELAGTLLKQFEEFMVKYGKTYSSAAEKLMRFTNFKENLKVIDVLNAGSDGTVQYGVNGLSDLTFGEFRARLNFNITANGTEMRDTAIESPLTRRDGGTGETDLTKSPYPPAPNQQQCGSCWAFATLGAIEIVRMKKTKHYDNLSEQQLIDCTKEADGGCDLFCTKNAGCKGGDYPQSFVYGQKTGFVLESTYPYIATDGTCKKNLQPRVFVSSYKKVSSAEALKALYTTPIPTYVNVDTQEFQHYTGGILRPQPCDPKYLNHCVVMVGHKKVGNETIVKVRNSWDVSWGENGHFRMPLGICGVGTNNVEFTLK